MPAPRNAFKSAILSGRKQVGLWLALANAYTADIAAGCGFDWLLIDGEHAPNDIRSILAQLQAIEPSGSHPVVRIPCDETWMIKQVLDIGAQTILIPMVESAEQARRIVSATQYAPKGIRGIGAALARASRFNAIGDYIGTAGDEVCVLIQVETRAGIDALDELVGIEGIDGIFVGASDLAADLGYPGNSSHPDVQAVVVKALKDIKAAGKAPGILCGDLALVKQYIEIGALFVATGTDVGVFAKGLQDLHARSAVLFD